MQPIGVKNAIAFFEIPAADFERAVAFYAAILDQPLTLIERTAPLRRFAVFPCAAEGVHGAILHTEGFAPSAQGTRVYLSIAGPLQAVLDRVASAGGRIVIPMTHLDEACYYAVVEDSEGNFVGLHSRS